MILDSRNLFAIDITSHQTIRTCRRYSVETVSVCLLLGTMEPPAGKEPLRRMPEGFRGVD